MFIILPNVTGTLLYSIWTPTPDATPVVPAESSATTPVVPLTAVPVSVTFTLVPRLQLSGIVKFCVLAAAGEEPTPLNAVLLIVPIVTRILALFTEQATVVTGTELIDINDSGVWNVLPPLYRTKLPTCIAFNTPLPVVATVLMNSTVPVRVSIPHWPLLLHKLWVCGALPTKKDPVTNVDPQVLTPAPPTA